MKTIKLFTLLVALLCTTTSTWATDYNVGTDAELRAAIQNDGANITVTADIDLSNSTLSIATNTTVTIDLGGHTLDRNLTQRGENGGQVITVREDATLNLSNGTLKGGWGGDSGGINNEGGTVNLTNVTITGCTGDDRGGGICNRSGGTLTMTGGSVKNSTSNDHGNPSGGGGIFNAEGATATLTDVAITGNEAKLYGGGGICNFGALNIDGASITGNTAVTHGGGIWQEGTLNMQGTVTVDDNVKTNGLRSNLYLKNGSVVTVTGALTGSDVSVGMETLGTFTSNFSTYHSSVHPADFFYVDQLNITSIALVDGEGKLSRDIPEGGIYYVERSWNDGTKAVEALFRTLESTEYTTLTGSDDQANLGPGYYVVKGGNVEYDKSIIFDGGGEHHLILCDGAQISAMYFIVPLENTLSIYGQVDGSGIMVNTYSYATYADAGLGGSYAYGGHAGPIIIHGGTIDVTGSPRAAGIGGGRGGDCTCVTIYGDTIRAEGRDYTGGKVYAYGGIRGAGIGGGWDTSGSDVTITGGYVYAEGGQYAAGIGSGVEALTSGGKQGGRLTVTGGYVEAHGGEDAAGIGGGEEGDGGNVTITGGTVVAHAGRNETGHRAIGPGKGSDEYGQLTLGDQMMVQFKSGSDWSVPVDVSSNPPYGRKAGAWFHTEARIEPCTHPGATYTDSGSSVNVGCNYCLSVTMPYTFNANGNWNDESKWISNLMPHEGNNVAVKADVTIPANCCANVGNVAIDGGSITIADGGQLIHNNAGVIATVQKDITGHGGDNNGGWNFIASPMVTDIIPAATNGFLTDNYDLYYYDEPTHYWMNHKDSDYGHFNIEPQKGYLYASQDNTTLSMTGTLQPSNNSVTISGLSHEASALNGFNLVGNPFACNATIDRPFYVIEGKHVVAYEGSEPIAPATGVMVQADADHENVTFTRVTPEAQASQPNNGSLQILLSQVPEPVEGPICKGNGVSTSSTTLTLDNAIVSFNKGSKLSKFYFGTQNANIYIPQDNEEYAIVSVSRDAARHVSTMDVNFKATEDGRYTITVDPDGLEMAYLHLVDNMTGADIDLLSLEGVIAGEDPQSPTPSYTFTAKTTDYESRFKLVFVSVCEDADGDKETFAFISNGELIVNGTGTLQIIDILGRELVRKELSTLNSKL